MFNDTKTIRQENPNDFYLAYHAPRYVTLIKILSEYVQDDTKILDIGRSKLTYFIAKKFDLAVDTLGFDKDRKTETGNHYQFDLNQCQFEDKWRKDLNKYNIVVMAEVIEHLYTSPRLVFKFLKSILLPGGTLIIQTPNAAVLHKRLLLLLGYNPYEQIRQDRSNPGHFREYTRQELISYANQTDFLVESCFFCNYFDYRFIHHGSRKSEKISWQLSTVNFLYTVLPKSTKPGITLVLRNQVA